VDEEIRAFKELGRSDRILALLIDGEPDAKEPALECLPQSLRFGKARADGTIDWEAPTQPIAADARPEGRAAEGWTTAPAYEQALEDEDKLARRQIAHLTSDYEKRLELAKLKVVAGALGVDLGELTKRNQVFELAKARRRSLVSSPRGSRPSASSPSPPWRRASLPSATRGRRSGSATARSARAT
jgi:hypothetical protein